MFGTPVALHPITSCVIMAQSICVDNTPDIEEDIVEERLRIDGICGVY